MRDYIIKILLISLITINISAITNEQWRETNLNDEEKQWVKDNPVLRYSEDNWKPIVIIENNEMQGIMGEYLKIVSEKSGIKMTFIPSSSWLNVLDKFKKGEIDLIPGVSDMNKLGLLSNAYVSYPMVAVSGDNSISYIHNIGAVKDKVFSVPKYWEGWNFIKKNIPNAKIVETVTIEEALLNVEQKKADIFIGHIAVASYNIATIAPSLRISGELSFNFNHHFLAHEKDKVFIDIVNKIIATIKHNDKMEIYSKWAFAEVKQDIDYIMVAKIVAGIIIVFLIILFYTIKLNRVLRTTKEQQKVLNESIDYALTVQLALMSNNHPFDDYFPHSFFIWAPKDKVGGDIYLSKKISDDEILIYVIDCIGHGIPGALLTVYVKAIEQQVLPHFQNLDEPLNTATILEFFHKKMFGLHSKNIDKNQALCFDGAVVYYNKKEKIIKFAGANTPIFYIQDKKIQQIKTNRRIVGVSSKRDKPFKEHSLKIDKDTVFYISTDGLMDQIGGGESLPLGKTKLQEKFLNIHKQNVRSQKQDIIKMLESYQGSKDRIDDITLVSFTIEA